MSAYWQTRAERFKGAKGTAEEMYAAEGPEIKAGKVQDRVLAQKGETDLGQGEYEQAPTYYSAAARFIDDAKQEKASPDQWRGMLKNAPGVKPEEVEWLGLDDWLKEQKGQVTKQQIADYIRSNAIEVKEVDSDRRHGHSERRQVGATRSEMATVLQTRNTGQGAFTREIRSVHPPRRRELSRIVADAADSRRYSAGCPGDSKIGREY